MKIIEPSFHIETPFGPLTHEVGQKLLVFIERQARISHRSEDLQNENSWKRFIEAVVIHHGDWSVVEHASITVIFRIDRGITHRVGPPRTVFVHSGEYTILYQVGKHIQKVWNLFVLKR